LTAGDYVVRAVKNGSSQTVTSGGDVVVTFIDDFDPRGWFASDKFQPTIAGYYSITAQVWWDAGAVTNNQNNIQIRKNGTTQLAISQDQIVTGAGYAQTLSTIVYFNGTTDYVEVTAFTGNTTSQNINGAASGTFFTAALYAYGPPGAQGVQGAPGSGGVANFPVSSNSGSTVTANGINFVNTSTITITTTSGVTGNANVSLTVSSPATYSVVFGDGSNTTYTFNHNLNMSSYLSEVRRVSTGVLVYPDVVIANANAANVIFTITPTTNEYRFSLIGF
jgi:hypothetical protein